MEAELLRSDPAGQAEALQSWRSFRAGFSFKDQAAGSGAELGPGNMVKNQFGTALEIPQAFHRELAFGED